MMDISSFSDHYHVRCLNHTDIPAIMDLCRGNSLYYQYCPPFVSEESIARDMAVLPPGKDLSDKYYIGYFDGSRLTAVMDLILAFPDQQTAFIGFFMTDASVQKKGIGSKIIEELCINLKKYGYLSVRLGWVKGNPQAEHFWKKNGFTETGVTYDTDGYTVVVAHKDL
jgi:GNAT superfamily N-acetyltransferase